MTRKSTAARTEDEMPAIDFSQSKIIQRGPTRERKLGLASLRGSQKLTQTQLAEKAGLAQSDVSRAESRSDCLVSTLDRYAKALGGELALYVKIDGRSYPIALVEQDDT